MGKHRKFNPDNLHRLNDPSRLQDLQPAVIWEKLKLQDPRVAVDIGAGTGLFSRAFLGLMDQGTVYACDISPTMVAWMEDNLVSLYPEIIPVQMKENQVPLEDGLADLVYMINLHHELDHPLKTLKESHRLLKNGGKLMIADWKPEPMTEGPGLEYRLEPEQVVAQLEKAGFKLAAAHDGLPKHFLITAQKKAG